MSDSSTADENGGSRRDILEISAWTAAAVGAGAIAWPLLDTMNPSADVLALASIEIDVSGIEPGMSVTVMWRGKPVFVRHRTEEEIAEAQGVDLADLPDPQADSERVQRDAWLVMVGVCTHLGCVPLGNKTGETKGEYNGWFCPCHGSHYDTSGRIRLGPAPSNLEVPDYAFVTDTIIRVG